MKTCIRRLNSVLAALLFFASGAVSHLDASVVPHKYDGNVQFDVSKVPFSRYGSYIAFSEVGEPTVHPKGLYLRIMHGAISHKELFRLEVMHGKTPTPFKEVATPTLLRLEAADGFVEICMAEPKLIRIRGTGVGLRLSMPEPEKEYSFAATYDFAFPHSDSQWEVNSFSQQVKFMVTALDGSLAVDAPWQGTRAEHVIMDFVPGASKTFQGALEEFPSVWHPRQYKQSFDAAHEALQAEYRQWLAAMPEVPEEYGKTAELAAYVDWESVVAPGGHLTRPAMLMSKNWMTNYWSWDGCFNAMLLSYKKPEMAWDQLLLLADNQAPEGAYFDWMNDQVISWSFTKPPVHGWALGWMLKRMRNVDEKKLAVIYSSLSRWTDWYFQYRDDDHDGVPEYNHGNDSGWDNATIFLARPPIEAPDLSALLVVQMDELAEVATRLHKPDEAKRWKARADELLAKMLAICWKGDHFVAPQSGTHEAYASQSIILYLPIILGDRLPRRYARN